MTHDPLLRFRAEFPILERSTYLVSNSLGAMPRAVPEELARYAAAWADRGVRAWGEGWWEMPVTVGDEIAPLIGAGRGEVAMVASVTAAHAAVVSALDYAHPRDTIVMTALDFPSVRYVCERLASRLGARIVVVPSDDGISIDEERLLEAIDERTRLVALSHVLFRSAYVMDVDRICRHAHGVGALVASDAYHSVGVLPIDVKGSSVDFLAGGVLKWLCGGPGGCFLYVRPQVGARLEPALTGWQAHARPFGFEGEMEYGEGAFRWLSGTPQIPALHAALAGPRIIRDAGIDAVRAKSMRQTARIVELAGARGYSVRASPKGSRRGGSVAVDVPQAYEVARWLLARDVVVDYRPGAGIRIAPHFYTTDQEIEDAVAAIDECLATAGWRGFVGRPPTVT
ncbi:MAG: kynureninase [Gemmatimonadaceae bacterium]